jgi:hypothetical protein
MSTILEQIIRQTLLEKSGVTILKNASDKQFAKAKASGAAFAYAVKVKGISDPAQIILEVANMSRTSTNLEGDISSAAVGMGSKYATKNYIYVMSEPLPKKRQLVNVWIMPYPEAFNRLTGIEAGGKDKGVVRQTGVAVTKQSPNMIGAAELIPVKQYNSRAIQTGVKQLQIESEADLETSKGRKLVDYPYKWESGTGPIEVWTIPLNLNNNQEDTLVYIQNTFGKWLQYDKVRFERFLNKEDETPEFTKVEDTAKIKLLNDIKSPPTPKDPEVVKWDEKNGELQDKLSKAQQKYNIKLNELIAAIENAKLTGGSAELQKAEDNLQKFKKDSKEVKQLQDATEELQIHKENKPGAASEKAAQAAAELEKQEKAKIDKQAADDVTAKAEADSIIAATQSPEYSDITKSFQKLMIDKLSTKPDVVEKLSTKYTKVANNIDGQWGKNSIDLTKVLQRVFYNVKENPSAITRVTGYPDSEFIKQIKDFDKANIIKQIKDFDKANIKNENINFMKNILREQDFNLSDFEDITPISNSKKPADQTKTTPEKTTEPNLKPKSDSKFEAGKKYKLELKPTRLYYFMNNKFVESDYKWVAPNSSYIKYVTTSKQNKNWVLVEVDGKQFWVPMDKISKITAVQ